jgi:hypothetical protein
MITVLLIGPAVMRLSARWLKSVLMPSHKIKMALILYVFHDFSILEALQMARKFNIRRSMHKDMTYGALMELVKNKSVWHESSVSPEYSHLTDDGKDAIIHVVEEMFRGMQTIHNQEVKEEAKRQTFERLK